MRTEINKIVFYQRSQVNNSREKHIIQECIIWDNVENLMRIKVSKKIFFNSKFHHPPEFYQLMIIIY